MKCKKCNARFQVVETRTSNEDEITYRKRVCKSCGNTVYTVESIVEFTDEFYATWKANSRGDSSNYWKQKFLENYNISK